MKTFEIDNVGRASAFLAQLAHESGEFQFVEELWGPIAAQMRYEPAFLAALIAAIVLG